MSEGTVWKKRFDVAYGEKMVAEIRTAAESLGLSGGGWHAHLDIGPGGVYASIVNEYLARAPGPKMRFITVQRQNLSKSFGEEIQAQVDAELLDAGLRCTSVHITKMRRDEVLVAAYGEEIPV